MITNKIIHLICVFGITILVSVSPVISQSGDAITDQSDDVGKIQWIPEGGITYQTVNDRPNIDILTASYEKNDNGSITIELTVKGQILTDNHSYYYITILDSSNANATFKIEVIYGMGFHSDSGSFDATNKYSYSNSSSLNLYRNGFGNFSSFIQSSKLILTLDNKIISATNENFTISYPKIFPDTFEWHIITWEGDNSQIASGDWYYDYYPNTDNHFTTAPSPSTPGFELLSFLIFPIILVVMKSRDRLNL